MERNKPNTNKSKVPQPTAEQIKTMSMLTTRMAYAANLGVTYDGKRDLYEALGYSREITPEMYFTQFKRQDIAKAIINRPVRDTWKGGVLLVEVDDAEETPFEKAWKDLVKDLKLNNVFARLDRLTGLGRYGILLLGFDDVTERSMFSQPVGEGKRNLMYVKVLGEKDATIKTYVTDTKNERFGMPLLYQVNLVNPTGDSFSMDVHYSRIIHCVDEAIDNEIFGTPRLEAVFNRLQDLEKIIGGSAEMFWRGARPGYQGKVDPEFVMGTEERDQLKDQIDEYEHNLRRMFVNEGVELKTLESQVSDPLNHVDIQIQMISAVTGIPKRILTGSERGELSSGQDADEWNSLIVSRREEFAEPIIVKAFADLCIKYQILPEPSEDYTVMWSDIFSISEKERVDIGKVRADALAAYSKDPVAQSIVPVKAFFEFFLGLNQDQIDMIKQMNKEGMTNEERDLLPEEIEESEEVNEVIPVKRNTKK